MVAFEASTSLPSMSRLPWLSRTRADCSAAALAPSAGAGCGAPCWLPDLRAFGARPAFGPGAGSGMADSVTVLPGAHMPGRVQRQPAERAGWPALADELQRALREGTRSGCADPHPQDGGTVLGNILGQRLDRLVSLLLGLDDDALVVVVPRQCYRADPELLHQRQLERAVVGQGGRRGRRHRRAAAAAPEHFVQQLVEPLGELADLALLQRNASDPAAGAGLQVEGALPRLADRPGDEPVRWVVRIDRHDPILPRRRRPARRPRREQPPAAAFPLACAGARRPRQCRSSATGTGAAAYT